MTSETDENTVKILGIPIFRGSREDAFQALESGRRSGEGGYACFVNVHTATTAATDAGLESALKGATYAFPDGVPLVWSSRLYGRPVTSRISGPDFMAEFIRTHAAETFGFIGGQPGQAKTIGRRFGVKTVAYCPPFRPFSAENAREDFEALERAAKEQGLATPHFVWVCLGAPKQESWMQANRSRFPNRFFFGVGAAIDFLSETKRRAPVWLQRLGLEWLYRLLQEPSRLWKRYLTTNTQFVIRILGEVFSRR